VNIGEAIARWLLEGNPGVSSKAMASVALGVTPKDALWCHPRDPDDFNRCIKFVDAVPYVKGWFHEIRQLSPQWAAVIDNWDRLRTSFIEEAGYDWSNSNRCPETYKLWKSLGL
jgi:hypothetical protein